MNQTLAGLGQTSTAPASTVNTTVTAGTIASGLATGLMLPVSVAGIGFLMALFGSGATRIVGLAAIGGGAVWFLYGVGQIH
jgi:hypothetical protein